MSRNKQTVRSATDKADDVVLDQTVLYDYVYGNGHSLGDYTPNDSILQAENAQYSKKMPNVQSAIETLSSSSQLPVGTILTRFSNINPNDPSQNQSDVTVLSFLDGKLETTEDNDIYIYGVKFNIPSGSTINDIKDVFNTKLQDSNLFASVVAIVDEGAETNIVYETYPIIVLEVVHKTNGKFIPCYTPVADNGNMGFSTNPNARTYPDLFVESWVDTVSQQGSSVGYGVWSYLGNEEKTLSGGELNNPMFFYFKRES